MKAPSSTLTQHIWVFFAPFCWLIGLAITHELCSSQGYLRPHLEQLVALTHPQPSVELLGVSGLLLGGLVTLGVLWLTHQQNQPPLQRALLSSRPTLTEGAASVCLFIGATIVGSELDNVLSHMGGEAQPPSVISAQELQAWRLALWSAWGALYELALLPLAECFIFHQVVQRCVPIRHEWLRVAFTTLVMTTFSWRLSSSPMLVNLCGAWLFERVRSPSLSCAFYFDFQLVSWLIALGYGPQIEGFDLINEPWQPWGFNLFGVGALLMGVWLLDRSPPFNDRRAEEEWRALIQAELRAHRPPRPEERADPPPEGPPEDEDKR